MHFREVFGNAERFEATLLTLAEKDWELAAETFAHEVLGWSKGQLAHQWAAFIRASVSQSDFLRIWRSAANWDVSLVLPQISAQTLVLSSNARADHSLALTSKIPGAQLVRVGPEPRAVYEHEEGMRLVEEFLGIETLARAPAGSKGPDATGLVTILFTDLVSDCAD